MCANGLAMNSTGANWRLLSATHIAKSFFSFPYLKQKLNISLTRNFQFCGLHKNTQTFCLSPKPVLFISCVVASFIPLII
tara:strand:- start:1760 stop:1999 length:240 start_codon:yes stop_codon:yes gene_type:complete